MGVVRMWLGVGGAVWGSGGVGLGLGLVMVEGDRVAEMGGIQLGLLRACGGGRGGGQVVRKRAAAEDGREEAQTVLRVLASRALRNGLGIAGASRKRIAGSHIRAAAFLVCSQGARRSTT